MDMRDRIVTRPTCSNCPYWLHYDGGDGDEGECHRLPPQLVVSQAEGCTFRHAEWPPTLADGCCGEHPGFLAHLIAQPATRAD